jgi:hypothetical protein
MANPHIYGCSIVYFPGHGGNFFKLCLSLSPETVPYYPKKLDTLSNDECIELHNITPHQRYELNKFGSNEDYKKIHTPVTGDRTPMMHYDNPLINNCYSWAISGNHPDNVYEKTHWLKKMFYLELDLEKYSKWVLSAQQYFTQNKMFFPAQHLQDLRLSKLSTVQLKDELYVRCHNKTEILSMTEILDSQQGFEKQYQMACGSLGITPVMDVAIKYYQDWRKVRVDPFL